MFTAGSFLKATRRTLLQGKVTLRAKYVGSVKRGMQITYRARGCYPSFYISAISHSTLARTLAAYLPGYSSYMAGCIYNGADGGVQAYDNLKGEAAGPFMLYRGECGSGYLLYI